MAILRSEEGRLWRVWPQGTILPSRLSLRGYHCMCQFGDPIHVMGIHHSRQHWQYGLWVGWQAGHVACHGLRGIAGKWDAWGFFLAQSWPLQRCIDLTEKDSEGLQAYKRSRTPFCRWIWKFLRPTRPASFWVLSRNSKERSVKTQKAFVDLFVQKGCGTLLSWDESEQKDEAINLFVSLGKLWHAMEQGIAATLQLVVRVAYHIIT